MKINCIHCGHAFGLDDSYADYEGLVRCGTCGGVLEVRTQDGCIRSVRPGSISAARDSARREPSPQQSEPGSSPDIAGLLAQIQQLQSEVARVTSGDGAASRVDTHETQPVRVGPEMPEAFQQGQPKPL